MRGDAPRQRRPLAVRLLPLGAFARVQPYEVVQAVPAVRGAFEEARGLQYLQEFRRARGVDSGGDGGRRGVEGAHRRPPQEPVEPGRFGRQRAVRRAEYGGHLGLPSHRHSGEPPSLVGELRRQAGHGQTAVGEQPGRHHVQRHRKAAAQLHQPFGRGPFGGHGVLAAAVGEEPHPAVSVQRVQGDQPGAVQDQFAELPVAGDEHRAAGSLGDEGSDLRGVADVVEDDQQAAPRGVRPEQGGALGERARHPLVAHAERSEAHGDGLGDVAAGLSAQAREVHVHLAVRVQLPGPVRPVAGGRGLADAGHAVEHTDADGGGAGSAADEAPVQGGQVGRAVDERDGQGGHLVRSGLGVGGVGPGGGEFVEQPPQLHGRVRVLAEDLEEPLRPAVLQVRHGALVRYAAHRLQLVARGLERVLAVPGAGRAARPVRVAASAGEEARQPLLGLPPRVRDHEPDQARRTRRRERGQLGFHPAPSCLPPVGPVDTTVERAGGVGQPDARSAFSPLRPRRSIG